MKQPLDKICSALHNIDNLHIDRKFYSSGERLMFTYKDEWLAICRCELYKGEYFLYYAVDDGTGEPPYTGGTPNEFISLMKNTIAQRQYIL